MQRSQQVLAEVRQPEMCIRDRGGIAVAIQSELGIPVKYIGVGETIDDLQKFDSEQFVRCV